MALQGINVIRSHQMRLPCQLEGELEGGPIGGGEFFPIAVESRDVIVRQARDRELVFLVAQSVEAVIGP